MIKHVRERTAEFTNKDWVVLEETGIAEGRAVRRGPGKRLALQICIGVRGGSGGRIGLELKAGAQVSVEACWQGWAGIKTGLASSAGVGGMWQGSQSCISPFWRGSATCCRQYSQLTCVSEHEQVAKFDGKQMKSRTRAWNWPSSATRLWGSWFGDEMRMPKVPLFDSMPNSSTPTLPPESSVISTCLLPAGKHSRYASLQQRPWCWRLGYFCGKWHPHCGMV